MSRFRSRALSGAMKCSISGGLPVNNTASARRMALNAAPSNTTFARIVQTSREANFCFW
jgi:hypothetical protein